MKTNIPNWSPEQSAEEYESLKQSICENGLYEPITINAEEIILDGHHRFRELF
jgi:ParB-like chromosome segregation protein Spo0J